MMRDQGVLLAVLPPGRRDRLLALCVGLACLVALAAAAPFATTKLAPYPAFVACYESLLLAIDVVTAVLLYGQFAIVRSPGLNLLASGYLFSAMMAGTHMLSFPGLFTSAGLLGANSQSTAWLYMFWHVGFPATVIAYACGKTRTTELDQGQRGTAIAVVASVLAVCAVVAACTWLATSGSGLLPPIMQGNGYTPQMDVVVTSTWLMSLIALVALWFRRPQTVLDLWLMVVMCAWVSDIALSAVLNAGRFDLGFYFGRVNGLLAASFVLVMLLADTLSLYRQLIQSNAILSDLANRDGLTGVLNRRALDVRLRDELARAQRIGQAVSLLLIDVDHFKKFNDTYGHLDGDTCLREVAGIVARSARRPGDFAARYGGEEFAVVLSGVEARIAEELAEATRVAVMQASVPHAAGVSGVVTVSIGVATIRPDRTTTSSDIIAGADRALYAAKAHGRNRVAVNGAAEDDVPVSDAVVTL
jgi:diguanylate cyclase (GGDEF)-like protein